MSDTQTDHVIAVWMKTQKMWKLIGQPKGISTNRNFLITCSFGDYSGFQTFEECMSKDMPERQPNYFFIVER